MKIELSVEQLQVIGQVLEGAPYKIAAPLLAHLQNRINAAQRVEAPLSSPQPDMGNGELHAAK